LIIGFLVVIFYVKIIVVEVLMDIIMMIGWMRKMTKLSAADLMVIHNTLYKSLNVVGNSIWTQETRERVMDKVSIIMENMNAEVVCGDVEPIVVSGDLGG
jgi:hypothetical protein